MIKYKFQVVTRRFSPIFFVMVVLALAACSSGGGESSAASSTEPTTTLLSAMSNPENNSIINASTPIIISFNQSTDVSTLALGGSLESESDGGVWSSNSLSNDTLTISPLTAWSESAGATITVSVSDAANDSSVSLSYTYPVDATVPVVSLTPASDATISLSSQIVIQFDESMDTSSLALSGSMESESDGGVWSTTTNANDTLTISATTLWSSNQLSIDVTDVAGNAVATLVFSFTLDSSSPTALVIPGNGSLLANAATITITFSEAMDASSLVLSGELSSEDDGGAWSTDAYTNDTLTVSPAIEWAVGMGRSIVVNATDMVGNSVSEISLSYDTSAIYVSTSGNNGALGTHLYPKKTVQEGIDAAQSMGIKDVFIQVGTYAAVIDMKPGINVTGGYDTSWIYDSYTVSGHNVILAGTLDAGEYLTVKAHDINSSTLLKNLTVQAPNASGNPYGYGNSSYAIHTLNSSGMNLLDIGIVAGNGASGQSGSGSSDASQTAAPGGSNGGAADEYSSSCDATNRGTGGASGGVNAERGGQGGAGGTMDTDCSGTILTNDYDATKGLAGSSAVWGSSLSGTAGFVCGAGGDATFATIGTLGSGGTGGINEDGGDFSNFYQPPASTAGTNGNLGSNGSGGDGGGGSGGCDTGTDSYGAGGGGGGAGGVKSSLAGGGGQSGGSSFGIYVVNSTMQVTNTSITRATGGPGGAGTSGGLGQPGGAGGSGGAAVGDSLAGGNGADGGDGGSSGSGGGGAGGNSYGIFSESSTVAEVNPVIFTGGIGGAGGAGGSRSGTLAGNSGSNGGVYGTITVP